MCPLTDLRTVEILGGMAVVDGDDDTAIMTRRDLSHPDGSEEIYFGSISIRKLK